MGTNIYLVKIVTEEEIKELKDLFNSTLQDLRTTRDTSKVLEPLEEALNELKKEIHICKRSCGWQLIFQSHKELYECTWKSMTDYIRKVLNDGTYIMVDEYGGLYSLEDLKSDLKEFSNGHTGESYDRYHKDKGDFRYSVGNHEYISDGLRWTDDEFC